MSAFRRARTWVLATAALTMASAGAAQTVELVGSSDVALDRRLTRLLDGDPLIIIEDRRIHLGDTIRQSVLVLDATLIHEGTITGDLVLVDAGVFVRHQAVVGGDLVNIGGGLYRSERARIGGTIIDLPEASYRVVREEDRVVIEATRTPSRWEPDGFAGLRPPTYDRVSGLTATAGGAFRLPRLGGVTPRLQGHVGWRTSLGAVYGAELELQGGATTASFGYALGSDTRDDWAVGDVRNSLNYLWDGDDYRNYFEAERAWVAATREFGDVAKRLHSRLRLAAQIEDAASLSGSDPWHIFGDTARASPGVDDGRITSILGRLELQWHGFTTDLEAGAEYEAGRDWLDGAYTFDRLAAWAHFAMAGLFDHTLDISAFGQLPISGDTLPAQRWTLVGGPLTLPTATTGAHRGDHALFVRSRYRMPLPDAVALPLLGAPEVQLLHASGLAWLDGHDSTLIQEIGGRLQFSLLYVQYTVRPSDTVRSALVVGLTWPFGPAFPWEL